MRRSVAPLRSSPARCRCGHRSHPVRHLRRRHDGRAAAVTVTPDSGYAVSINQGNVPTTAAAFGAPLSADEFGSKAATDDGWLFVASPDDFTSFEAVFDQGTVFYNDPGSRTSAAGTSVAFPKPDEHLAVTTPAGWTLQNAYANLADKKGGAIPRASSPCRTRAPPPSSLRRRRRRPLSPSATTARPARSLSTSATCRARRPALHADLRRRGPLRRRSRGRHVAAEHPGCRRHHRVGDRCRRPDLPAHRSRTPGRATARQTTSRRPRLRRQRPSRTAVRSAASR